MRFGEIFTREGSGTGGKFIQGGVRFSEIFTGGPVLKANLCKEAWDLGRYLRREDRF